MHVFLLIIFNTHSKLLVRVFPPMYSIPKSFCVVGWINLLEKQWKYKHLRFPFLLWWPQPLNKLTFIHSMPEGNCPFIQCLLVPRVKHYFIFNPMWRSVAWCTRWEVEKGLSEKRYQESILANSPLPLPAMLDCMSPVAVFMWIQMLTLKSYPWSSTSLKKEGLSSAISPKVDSAQLWVTAVNSETEDVNKFF